MTNADRRQILDRTKALQSMGVNVSIMDTLRNPGLLNNLEQQVSTGQTQEVATTPQQQMQGLQNRPPSQIPDEYVMKNVAPGSTVHTNNVRVPLDIDYKDPKTGHLLESYKSVQPGTVLPGTPHNQSIDVVESPARSMMRLGGVRRKFQTAGAGVYGALNDSQKAFTSESTNQFTPGAFDRRAMDVGIDQALGESKLAQAEAERKAQAEAQAAFGKKVDQIYDYLNVQEADYYGTGPSNYLSQYPEAIQDQMQRKRAEQIASGQMQMPSYAYQTEMVDGISVPTNEAHRQAIADYKEKYDIPDMSVDWLDRLATPMTQLTGILKHKELPSAAGMEQYPNIFDVPMSLVNPFEYARKGRNAYEDFSEGDYVGGAVNAIGAIPLWGKAATAAKFVAPATTSRVASAVTGAIPSSFGTYATALKPYTSFAKDALIATKGPVDAAYQVGRRVLPYFDEAAEYSGMLSSGYKTYKTGRKLYKKADEVGFAGLGRDYGGELTGVGRTYNPYAFMNYQQPQYAGTRMSKTITKM